MTIVKLDLDNQTFESIKRIATHRRATVETFIQDLVQRLVAIENINDSILGMLAQEPDLGSAKKQVPQFSLEILGKMAWNWGGYFLLIP